MEVKFTNIDVVIIENLSSVNLQFLILFDTCWNLNT